MFMGKLFVVVIALLGLAGCSQEEPPSKAEAPRTELAYASTKDIRNINPHPSWCSSIPTTLRW